MVNDRLPDPSDPEAVGRAEFATARRGFDQMQVRSYLTVVAQELRRLRDRESELVRDTEALNERLTTASQSPVELDDAALTARLGEEMTRVLETARAAAAEKLRHAEQTAEELVAAATAEAERITGGAQAAFEAEVEAGRAEGRKLVAEARLVRERMLDDLAQRRRTIRTQVEQLRSGRDRLLATHGAVRAALDEIEAELDREMPEARTAAKLTGRRLQHEPAGSAAMIELEIQEAIDSGAPLVNAEDLATRAEDEPAEWVNAGAAVTVDDETATSTEQDSGPHTDEIPVLDHFGGEGDDPSHHEIVLADVGHRRRDHHHLPRDPVPLLEAPDAVEEVRVVDAAAAVAEEEPTTDAAEEEPTEVEDAEAAADEESALAERPIEEPIEALTGDAADQDEVDEPVEPEPGPESEPEPEPEPEPVAEVEPEPEPAPRSQPGPSSPVDDLFARIRNSRAETVARAREVLDQPFEDSGRASAVATLAITATPEAPEAAEDEREPERELEPDAARVVARDGAVNPIETVIARKLKRMLADEQNEVQDLVRRKHGNVRADEIVGAHDHHIGRYVAAVGGELLNAVSAGASFHGPGSAPKDTDLSAIEDRLAHELLDPLRQLLSRGVEESVGAEDELLDRVRSAYREVKSQRVDVAARVVTLSAFNLGIVEAQPEGARLRWLVDPTTGCSPDCLDNELEGPVLAGEPFPTGAIYPPNHPGCRCLLVPADQ